MTEHRGHQGSGLDVDDARRLPHLRAQAPRLYVAPDNGTKYTQTTQLGGQLPRARSNDGVMVDPRDLRGIPIVGRGVGGVSPQTQPERETIRRISREEDRAA